MLINRIRRLASAVTTAIIKRKCSVCKDRPGVLHCDDDSWICETCAQVMSEMAPD